VIQSSTSGCVAALETRVVASFPVCREHVALEFVGGSLPAVDAGTILTSAMRRFRERLAKLSALWSQGAAPTRSAADQPFLRRPFSIADHWTDAAGGVHLAVISRTVGRGTAWLESLRPGDTLNVTGPLGRGFRIPEQDVPLVLIGGGVGIPPMLYLARRLHELGRREVCIIFGATTRDLLPVALRSEPPRDGGAAPCVVLPGGLSFWRWLHPTTARWACAESLPTRWRRGRVGGAAPLPKFAGRSLRVARREC
jgi:hypothetical protein